MFTIKFNADGNINRFKIRLVAKSFTQSFGIDYEETIAPVTKFNIVYTNVRSWQSGLTTILNRYEECLSQLKVRGRSLHGDITKLRKSSH